MEGWIYLHKKIQEWEWYQDSEMVHLFVHFLTSANYTDKKWRGIIVKRGQFPTGLYSISEKTGISLSTVRTLIKRLKSTNEITTQSTNQYTLITLVNYEKYQQNQHTKKQANQQTTNKQLTTTNKDNKDNKEEEEQKISSWKTKTAYKKKTRYYKPTGEIMRFSAGKWWVIPKHGGDWLLFAGNLERDTAYK